MAKLNKRQIIILAVAVVFILYAAYEFLIAGPAAKKAKAAADPAQVNTFVSDLQKDLIKDIIAGVDAYIITKAEANWEKNPFWDKRADLDINSNCCRGYYYSDCAVFQK